MSDEMRMRWQPIATAPRDGTLILACGAGYDDCVDCVSHNHPQTVRWEVFHPNAPGKGVWRDKNGHKQAHVTHWIPLPGSPLGNRARTRPKPLRKPANDEGCLCGHGDEEHDVNTGRCKRCECAHYDDERK